MQPLHSPVPVRPARTRGRHALAITLGLSLILVACEGDTNGGSSSEDETAEATRTVIGTLPTLTPPPTGTTGAVPSASGTPSGTPGDATSVGYGVATVEIETGEVAVLYEGEEAFQAPLGAGIMPLPEAKNGAVWLSLAEDEAVRYALDGSERDRIEGWGVLESEDGRARSYFVPGGSDGTATLVVEHEDGQRAEADGRNASNRQFSPDGRWLAWLAASPETNRVMLMDVTTGDVTTISEVEPCACDGYHYLEWSPSSRFLAYHDPAPLTPTAGGIHVYDTQAPDAEPQRIEAEPVLEGWIEADQREFLLVMDGQMPTITPVRPADAPEEPSDGPDPEPTPSEAPEPLRLNVGSGNVMLQARTLQGLVAVTRGEQPSEVTVIFDPVSGERLRELRGTSDTVLTPNGIATATITRNDIACTGITVDHPDLKETLDCTADDLRWSPDGRYLALIPQSQTAPVAILDVTNGEIEEVPHAGPRGTVPQWSEDGRYLVWAWGGQV